MRLFNIIFSRYYQIEKNQPYYYVIFKIIQMKLNYKLGGILNKLMLLSSI